MKTKSVDEFKKLLNKRLIKNPINNSKVAVTRGTLLVENTAKSSLTKGGTGNTVLKYNPKRTHTQSAPNKPPASDTGFLVSQITMDVTAKEDGSVIGQIISAAPYSKHLEFGTTNMTERPYMHPAFVKNKTKILKIFKKEGLIK